ncbi:MAG: ABC transporter substrate-binding protein [Actinobacteria bacterium]|nr:ABC transporter substrate-binding protein [Actinomycetota bacterium]
MRRWVVVALAIGVLATGCSSGAGKNPLRLGALYPLGGAQGPGGIEEFRGVQLAVERANAAGGVDGRHVVLDSVNVESAEAAPAAVRRVAGDGARIVLGSYGSTISSTASTAAAARNLLFWETGAVGETPSGAGAGRTFFRAPPTGVSLGQAGVSFMRDVFVPKLSANRPLRYTVVYVDDAYGRAVGLGAVDELRRSGQVVANVIPYAARGTDYAALAQQVAADHPDVMFASAYLDDGIALRKALVAAHVPLMAAIGTSSSYCMPAFGAALGAAAVGLFASDKPDADDVRPSTLRPDAAAALRWVQSKYEKRFHTDMSAAALAGFANTWGLLVHVLPAASSMTPAGVARAALSVKLPLGGLPNGSGIDFAGPGTAAAGSNRNAASVIWQWVAPGKRTVVWPPSFAYEPLKVLPIEQ